MSVSSAQSLHLPQAGRPDVLILTASPGHELEIPGGNFLLTADFHRAGSDLVLTGKDGHEVVVRDYFASHNPPDLISGTGGVIHADLAERLAGAIAPGQWAQDGAPAPQLHAIGEIQKMSGTVKVHHIDGHDEILKQGATVFQGDVLETSGDGSVGIVFADRSTFSLGKNGRMVMDELVYDPQSHTGHSSMSVVQGTFSFVSGQIAKSGPDNMSVKTPVMTIGIRGTTVAGTAAAEGTQNTIALLSDDDGGVGQIVVATQSGQPMVLTQANMALQLSSAFQAPPAPVVLPPQALQQLIPELHNVQENRPSQPTSDPKINSNASSSNASATASETGEAAQENLKPDAPGTISTVSPNGDKALAPVPTLATVTAPPVAPVVVAPVAVVAVTPVTVTTTTSSSAASTTSTTTVTTHNDNTDSGSTAVVLTTVSLSSGTLDLTALSSGASTVDLVNSLITTASTTYALSGDVPSSSNTLHLIQPSSATVTLKGTQDELHYTVPSTTGHLVMEVTDGGTLSDSFFALGGSVKHNVAGLQLDGVSTVTLGATAAMAALGLSSVTFAGSVESDVLLASGDSHALTVSLTGGHASIHTGSGNDTIYLADNAYDTIDGGAGTDVLNLSHITRALTVDLAGGSVTGFASGSDVLTNIEYVVGNDYGDLILGGTQTSVHLYGGLGNDTLIAGGQSAYLSGGGGTDSLIGIGYDTLVGGAGGDLLIDSGAYSTLIGGNGDNILIASGTGSYDSLIAGSGNDTMIAGGAQSYTLLQAGAGNNTLISAGAYGTLIAGSGNDVLNSTGSFNLLSSGDGNDTLIGQAMYNSLIGGNGNDLLSLTGTGYFSQMIAGSGDNTLIAGSSQSYVLMSVGGGDNTLIATSGNNTLSVGNGHDTLIGLGSYNSLIAGNGNDSLYGQGMYDSLIAGDGNDLLSLTGTGYWSQMRTGNGDSTLIAGSGQSYVLMTVGTGDNTLIAGGSYSTLWGGGGHDLFYTNGGSNIVHGGGSGTLSYANMTGGVTANLTTGSVVSAMGTDSFSGITQLLGSSHNDKFVGSGLTIDGSGGTDTLELTGASFADSDLTNIRNMEVLQLDAVVSVTMGTATAATAAGIAVVDLSSDAGLTHFDGSVTPNDLTVIGTLSQLSNGAVLVGHAGDTFELLGGTVHDTVFLNVSNFSVLKVGSGNVFLGSDFQASGMTTVDVSSDIFLSDFNALSVSEDLTVMAVTTGQLNDGNYFFGNTSYSNTLQVLGDTIADGAFVVVTGFKSLGVENATTVTLGTNSDTAGFQTVDLSQDASFSLLNASGTTNALTMIATSAEVASGTLAGGAGVTDLKIYNGGVSLNSSAMSGHVSNMDVIDLGSGADTLTLNSSSLSGLLKSTNAVSGDAHALIVVGSSAATVNLVASTGSWVAGGTVNETVHGVSHSYTVYNNTTAGEHVYVDSNISHVNLSVT